MGRWSRWFVLGGSIVIQVCLGGIYAWSVFVPALMRDYGLSAAQTQVIFGATIGVFALSMVYAGRLQDRKGPRMVAVIGGVLFGAGYVLSSFYSSFWSMVCGIGVVSGAGIGFGYVCPLATCIKWFPKHKGFITGVSVAGFGAGGIVMSSLARHLLDSHDAHLVFRAVGLIYGVVIVLSALLLRVPEDHVVRPAGKVSSMAVLKTGAFWTLFVGMFTGTFAGLMIIGNLKPMGLMHGISKWSATLGVSLLAAGNAAGRLSWGFVFDRLGRRSIFMSLLFLAASVSVLLLASDDAPYVYHVACILIGFGFGACFVLYAASVAVEFGSDRMGSIYPWVFLSYGLSAITGPLLGGWIHDRTGNYAQAILIAALLCAVGGVVTALGGSAFRGKSLAESEGD